MDSHPRSHTLSETTREVTTTWATATAGTPYPTSFSKTDRYTHTQVHTRLRYPTTATRRREPHLRCAHPVLIRAETAEGLRVRDRDEPCRLRDLNERPIRHLTQLGSNRAHLVALRLLLCPSCSATPVSPCHQTSPNRTSMTTVQRRSNWN